MRSAEHKSPSACLPYSYNLAPKAYSSALTGWLGIATKYHLKRVLYMRRNILNTFRGGFCSYLLYYSIS